VQPPNCPLGCFASWIAVPRHRLKLRFRFLSLAFLASAWLAFEHFLNLRLLAEGPTGETRIGSLLILRPIRGSARYFDQRED